MLEERKRAIVGKLNNSGFEIENLPDTIDIYIKNLDEHDFRLLMVELGNKSVSSIEELQKHLKNVSHPIINPILPEPIVPLSNESVTSHTANLWKYIEIPANEPEPHTEYDIKEKSIVNGHIFGARVRGKKHKHEGSNCDDWFEFDNIDDWVFICVSDGAGSKKLSRIGARVSCCAVVKYLKEKLSIIKKDLTLVSKLSLDFSESEFTPSCGALTDIVQKSVLCGYDAVEATYTKRKDDYSYKALFSDEMSFKDFSATLLVAVLIPTTIKGQTEYLVITCQIGDGMLMSLNTHEGFDKALKLLGEPDGGDFSGETDFLTSPQMKSQDALKNRTKVSRRKITHLMVMTDGVADDYYPNNPALIRLYYDLKMNGVIESKSKGVIVDSKENLDILKKIPDPLAFPWVNDASISVALQYSNRIIKSTGLSESALWDNEDIINAARLTVSQGQGVAPERLKTWLDNYVERGSFDDRTLVIFEVN